MNSMYNGEVNENEVMKPTNEENGVSDRNITFSKEVLDNFKRNVGKFRAETGGMLASKVDENYIDTCHFDTHSQNSPGTFYYDVESMSEVFRQWRDAGYVTNGIYHSHPRGFTRPSYHDISSALLHIRFFNLDYFYLPIIQPDIKGNYTMYFYVVKEKGDNLTVNLNYVVKAEDKSYDYIPFMAYTEVYSVKKLEEYRASVDRANAKAEEKAKVIQENKNSEKYFVKIKELYPEHVREKVIVCVGTGGARSFLENCARSGFKNYILIDKDIVSPSNVATQGVFISEMGKKKVEVIRKRILDINPDAEVVCVEKFLDDYMSDEEFKGYLDMFPDKKPTDYLILGCTDNFYAQRRSAMLALKYGMPYEAAMMYQGGSAAEIIFTYPGVTKSCPRCLLRERFEMYEKGFENNVDSSACTIFATERMNATKGYIALMLLMYGEDENNPMSRMLDDVKDRNFVWMRLNPYLKDTPLGITLFDNVLASASRYTFMDETLWIPQKPDSIENGTEPCLLCHGEGDLRKLTEEWADKDTRRIKFEAERIEPQIVESCIEIIIEQNLNGGIGA